MWRLCTSPLQTAKLPVRLCFYASTVILASTESNILVGALGYASTSPHRTNRISVRSERSLVRISSSPIPPFVTFSVLDWNKWYSNTIINSYSSASLQTQEKYIKGCLDTVFYLYF
jgi:hypothetical protein